MKIRYDPESDVLFFVLRENPPIDAIEGNPSEAVKKSTEHIKPEGWRFGETLERYL